jgi:hypothetical protein
MQRVDFARSLLKRNRSFAEDGIEAPQASKEMADVV